MINARADTVASKPSFRSAFKRRRCLVPADGFYEWQKVGKGKQPFFIHRKDEEPFAFAGECIAVRLRLVNRVVTNLYDAALRPLGLKVSQLNILVVTAKLGLAQP